VDGFTDYLGRYWKKMDSIISGHALNEAGGRWFVDQSINTTARFDEYTRSGLGNRTGPAFSKILERLGQLYPAVETQGSPFKDTRERLALYTADAGFNCHHRAIAQAYPGKTWTYQASLLNGTHYMDQFPSFFDPNGKGMWGFLARASPDTKSLQAFQSYLVSEIITGNPNTLRDNARTIEWPITTGLVDPGLKGVLNFSTPMGPQGFSIVTSQRLVKERCEFWDDVWSQLGEATAVV
jgi:hypothetical protein